MLRIKIVSTIMMFHCHIIISATITWSWGGARVVIGKQRNITVLKVLNTGFSTTGVRSSSWLNSQMKGWLSCFCKCVILDGLWITFPLIMCNLRRDCLGIQLIRLCSILKLYWIYNENVISKIHIICKFHCVCCLWVSQVWKILYNFKYIVKSATSH